MSWHFYMVAPLKADGGMVYLDGYSQNYTYNVSPMYYKAFAEVTDQGIRGLDGKQGKECVPMLEHAIKLMVTNATEYRAMNPANGWGNYDGALEILQTILEWCRELPEAYVKVS